MRDSAILIERRREQITYTLAGGTSTAPYKLLTKVHVLLLTREN